MVLKLWKALKSLTEANFRFWGGEKMKGIGGDIVKHINQLSFMGFWEVLKNILKILKNINFVKVILIPTNRIKLFI